MTSPTRFDVVGVSTMLVLAAGTVFGVVSERISTATGGRSNEQSTTETPNQPTMPTDETQRLKQETETSSQ